MEAIKRRENAGGLSAPAPAAAFCSAEGSGSPGPAQLWLQLRCSQGAEGFAPFSSSSSSRAPAALSAGLVQGPAGPLSGKQLLSPRVPSRCYNHTSPSTPAGHGMAHGSVLPQTTLFIHSARADSSPSIRTREQRRQHLHLGFKRLFMSHHTAQIKNKKACC